MKLMRSLVISVFLYACEKWTMTTELKKRPQAFEMRCYRRLLNIFIRTLLPTRKFAERSKQPAIGKCDKLLTLVKKRKVSWFGHVLMSSGLAKTILQGKVNGKEEEADRRRGGKDNIKKWTGMDFASSATDKVERDCCKFICGAPTTFQGYGIE